MRDDKDEARVRVPVDVRPSRRDLGGGDEGEGGTWEGYPSIFGIGGKMG